MDVEKANHSRKRNRTCCCIGTTICIIIAIVIVVLILALTVFKAKRPVISYDNMSIKELDASFDITKFKVHLNLTIDVDLSIKNPNKVGFKFSNSTAFLNYRGQLVGEVPVPADEISASETKAMNVSLTLLADRLLSDSDLYSDVKSGVLALSSKIRLSGKVKILGLKFHAVSTSSCDFSIYISNRTIADQTCKYKTQL
ncbi:hypothetical protein SO802_031304 [Lithocarpus litseifolius]|uniref:Late embryogenesis abundant protein LEA-2 subgroup domain-containing protein n=1 Tax=Lithocarpus litseifolius TaxID=425828 RepID=A0AAW2BLM0_9ROSI